MSLDTENESQIPYLEQLRNSRNKAQVAYQEFMLRTRKGKNGLFCFFEGKDNPYYVPRIKRFTDDYHPIYCGGREKVLKVYELITIHPEYDHYKKAFFIDRDFNPPLPTHNPPIFETPCYAIENLYVSIAVFKEILKNEFQVSEVSPEFDGYIALFEQRQKEFHKATLLFNAWYACLIDIRNQEGKQTGVSLDDKLKRGFVTITLDEVTASYDFDKIKQEFPNAQEITQENLEVKASQFQSCEQHKVFRGKYEIQFFTTFIELMIQDSLKEQKHIKSRLKFTFGEKVSNDQAISIFSPYAETPESLLDYLEIVS